MSMYTKGSAFWSPAIQSDGEGWLLFSTCSCRRQTNNSGDKATKREGRAPVTKSETWDATVLLRVLTALLTAVETGLALTSNTPLILDGGMASVIRPAPEGLCFSP